MGKADEHEDKRFVELDGDPPELERLKDFLAQYSDYDIIKRDDNNKYCLTASRFEILPADVLRKEVENIIPKLKSLAEVKGYGKCRSVEIGDKIIGKNELILLPKTGAEADASVTIPTVKINGQDISTIAKQHQSKLDDLINDQNKLDALDYFGKEKKWVNLNKAYETVKLAIDWNMNINKKSKIVTNGWATETELMAFKDAANIYDDIYGTEGEGRHAKLYVKWWQQKHKNAKKSQMDPYEAEQLIKHLLDEWIK